MKREIKFRAWDNKKMQWIPDPSEVFFINQIVIPPNTGEFYIHSYDKWDIELLQFTGLHDVTGNEIYEEDILKFDDGRIAKVIWHEVGWYIESAPHSKMEKSFAKMDREDGEYSVILQSAQRYGNLKHGEVIGNIYENPELLKP